MKNTLFAVLIAVLSLAPLAGAYAALPAGTWFAANWHPMAAESALSAATRAQIVLLGEQHATPAHHLWQRDIIAALADEKRPVVIGLEQLPRSSQAALDAYVSGAMDEPQFLAESRWKEVWGHDFAAYRPVFELARARRIPMVALNVDRSFVRAVGKQGFAAAAVSGAPIQQPATPDSAYVEQLNAVFMQHAKTASPEAKARFVEAQTVWDRAMAEGLAKALQDRPGALAIAIMGTGHVENGYGVAHQLQSLGINAVVSGIPVPAPVEPQESKE